MGSPVQESSDLMRLDAFPAHGTIFLAADRSDMDPVTATRLLDWVQRRRPSRHRSGSSAQARSADGHARHLDPGRPVPQDGPSCGRRGAARRHAPAHPGAAVGSPDRQGQCGDVAARVPGRDPHAADALRRRSDHGAVRHSGRSTTLRSASWIMQSCFGVSPATTANRSKSGSCAISTCSRCRNG